MREYINSTDSAKAAVEAIVALMGDGAVRPLVGVDIETSPLPELVGYPGTTFDEEGNRVRGSKKLYQTFLLEKWGASLDPEKLAAFGVYLPTRLTGKIAVAEWDAFLGAAPQLTLDQLEAARYTSVQPIKLRLQTLRSELEELTSTPTSGRITKAGQAKVAKAIDALTAQISVLEGLLPSAEFHLAHPVDARILLHLVDVVRDGRTKIDPVRPGLDPYTSEIFLVQISLQRVDTNELLSWIFNTHLVEIAVLRPIFRLKARYIGANFKFDLAHLARALGEHNLPVSVGCTRVNSRMLYLGLKRMSHSLASCAKRYAGIEMSKEERDSFVGKWVQEPTPEQLEYAYTDSEVLFAVYDAQMRLADQRGQRELLDEFGQLSYLVALQELDGYQLNVERWMTIAKAAAEQRDAIARELEQMLLPVEVASQLAFIDDTATEEGEEDDRPDAVIRISQGKLVLERLEALLGLNLAEVSPQGKPSLQKDARNLVEKAYRERHNGETHPFFRLYALWSKLAKQVSTYGPRFLWYIHPLSGRIHPTINIAGTDTGRDSSVAPNLLNIPAAKEDGDPDFRGAFEAPKGFKLRGADYDAMELRIAGNITRDPVVKKMIDSGADPHSFTAAQMFHIRRSATVSAPVEVQDTFKYGVETYTIRVFEVPNSWADEQIADFALTEQVQRVIVRKLPGDPELLKQKLAEIAETEGDDLVKVLKKKATRGPAKTVTFLWLFQGTAFTLAVRTGLPIEQCEDFFARFAAVYRVMDAGMKELSERVLTQTIVGAEGTFVYSEAYGGLRRYFELPHNPSRLDYPVGSQGDWAFYTAQLEYKRRIRAIQREGCNVPAQGGNAVITAKARNLMVRRGRPYGLRPWLSVYDEIIAIAPETMDDGKMGSIIQRTMLESADEFMDYIEAGAEPGKVSRIWVKS